jgi:hypothetical protein
MTSLAPWLPHRATSCTDEWGQASQRSSHAGPVTDDRKSFTSVSDGSMSAVRIGQ